LFDTLGHAVKRLEQLCRYMTWPALSDERVHLNSAGHVDLKVETAWLDGSTHPVMTPPEFMQQLASQRLVHESRRSRPTGNGRQPTSAVLSGGHADEAHCGRNATATHFINEVCFHTPDPRRARVAG